MVSKSAWKIGLSLALLTALAAPRAAQATCPATCPTPTIKDFTELAGGHYFTTGTVDGLPASTPPDQNEVQGSIRYQLKLTDQLALQIQTAQSARCPVTVTYSTAGILSGQGAGTSSFFAEIETVLVKRLIEVVLDTSYDTGRFPSLTPGTYFEDHEVAVDFPVVEGDILKVEAAVFLSARANASGAGNDAIATFYMYPDYVQGNPELEICTP